MLGRKLPLSTILSFLDGHCPEFSQRGRKHLTVPGYSQVIKSEDCEKAALSIRYHRNRAQGQRGRTAVSKKTLKIDLGMENY